MANEIVVFTAGFLKPGDAIKNASFAQVLYDGKKENDVPLMVSGGFHNNIYDVGLWTGAHGDVRVSAPNHHSKKVHVVNFGSYEVWLDKI